MAVFAMTGVDITVDTLALTGFANSLEMSASAEELDVTTFGSNGFRQKAVGLREHMFSVDGFQDYAATGVDAFLGNTLGGLSTVTVGPNGAATAGDRAYFGTGRLFSSTPLTGDVGQPGTFSFGYTGDGPLVRGVYLHPQAARTSTGNGTAVALAGPTATQRLYANFHVLSVTGTGTITFTVATDDAVGMATPTTRITSTAFAAVGHEQRSVAGAFASETHARVTWTISGFTSCTFVVAAGVL